MSTKFDNLATQIQKPISGSDFGDSNGSVNRTGLAQQMGSIGFLVVLAASVVYAIATGNGDLVLVISAIAAMIMLHELGHLIVAKACGMDVTEYFVGFGPRLWSIRWKGTEYGVKAILAGGYVKIPGMSNLEEVDESREGATYRQGSFPRKLAVVSAGSAVHFILALSILWGLFSFVGMPSSNQVNVGGWSARPGGADPARSAGLKVGDIFVSIDNRSTTSFNVISSLLARNGNKPLNVVVTRSGEKIEKTVNPLFWQGKWRIGISVGTPSVVSGPLVAVPKSFQWFGSYVSIAAGTLGHTLSSTWDALTNPSVKANSPTNESRAMSILGATRLATQAAQSGVQPLLLILVMLNIFIGIFNLLPLPILDGGHAAVAIYERIRSKRSSIRYHADYSKMIPLMYLMFTVLVLLGGSLIYLDIVKPISPPFK